MTVFCKSCSEPVSTYGSRPKIFCSISCRNKDPEYLAMLSVAGKKAASRGLDGPNNPNWRGGTTVGRHKLMASKKYKDWRKAVYERDGYRCVDCGTPGTGKNLNADHIEPYSLRPDLVLEVSNGRTLCIDCHKATPTYGWKMFNELRRREKLCLA